MATRRDNKTEHVMKLITKDGVPQDGASENESVGIESAEIGLHRTEGEPLSYKTKLKIEIEPEIEVKDPNRTRQPRAQTVSVHETNEAGSDTQTRIANEDMAEEGAQTPMANEDMGMDKPKYENTEESIPDGTPYEKLDEDIRTPARPGITVFDEVRALRKSNVDILRQDELRREKKIQIENSLLHKSRSLINLSEMLTKELLPSVMERMDVCTCPVCTGNVLALALNALPTKYVTTDEGKQYTQLEVYKRQNELDVIAALTRACVRVKDSPRHEIIDDLNE
jgi:competence protein ComFB